MPSPRLASSLRARVLTGALLLMSAPGVTGCVDHAAEHRVRANAFLRGGDAAAALKECDDGLAGKPGNVPLLILRGKALFELDRLDESRGAYEASVAAAKGEDPLSLSEAYLGLAMVASRQKNWPEARKQFETLLHNNDRDATSHLNIAKACLEMHDVPCAVSHAEEAGRMRGNEEPVLIALGHIYLAADMPKEAELTFQHICEVIPGAATCPYGLALVAAKKGDKPRALAQLREAVKRKLPNPEKIGLEAGFAAFKDDPEFLAITELAKQK